jgi:hypothetical protein
MSAERTREQILREIAAMTTLERGKLCAMQAKSGRTYHNLQFWSGGRNRCEYVAQDQVGAVREAVDNYGRYRELTEEYAALAERQTREARTAGGAKKKASGTGCGGSRPGNRRGGGLPAGAAGHDGGGGGGHPGGAGQACRGNALRAGRRPSA